MSARYATPPESFEPVGARVVEFAALLRRAGMPVAVSRVALALRALAVVGVARRDDVRATLRACLTDRIEQQALFGTAFDLFWSDHGYDQAVAGDPLTPNAPAQLDARLARAFGLEADSGEHGDDRGPRHQAFAGSLAARDAMHRRDFAKMTPEEWAQACAAIRDGTVLSEMVATRRMHASASGGRIDWRRSLSAWARSGELRAPRRQQPRVRVVPLVVLVDISGSMRQYARILLYFVHALSQRGVPVHSFVFGHHLSPVSRQMGVADADHAVASVLADVDDWAAGTRIEASLHAFNRRWARRVLAQSATVLLITDGLESEGSEGLGREAERLAKSCRRLLWLNPLLRYDGFAPRASGIKTLLPWVERMIPVHNLDSLSQLAVVLEDSSRRHSRAPLDRRIGNGTRQ